MRPQKFVLIEATLHSELGLWLGVAYKITKGKYKYLFRSLKPQGQEGEVGEINRKSPTEDDLHPMLLQMEEKMFMLR